MERTSRWTFGRAAAGRVRGGSDTQDDQRRRRHGGTVGAVARERSLDVGRCDGSRDQRRDGVHGRGQRWDDLLTWPCMATQGLELVARCRTAAVGARSGRPHRADPLGRLSQAGEESREERDQPRDTRHHVSIIAPLGRVTRWRDPFSFRLGSANRLPAGGKPDSAAFPNLLGIAGPMVIDLEAKELVDRSHGAVT